MPYKSITMSGILMTCIPFMYLDINTTRLDHFPTPWDIQSIYCTTIYSTDGFFEHTHRNMVNYGICSLSLRMHVYSYVQMHICIYRWMHIHVPFDAYTIIHLPVVACTFTRRCLYIYRYMHVHVPVSVVQRSVRVCCEIGHYW